MIKIGKSIDCPLFKFSFTQTKKRNKQTKLLTPKTICYSYPKLFFLSTLYNITTQQTSFDVWKSRKEIC